MKIKKVNPKKVIKLTTDYDNEFPEMLKNSDNECPYRNSGCKTLYKWVVYCYTKKYFKCIEYQVLRIAGLNRKVKAKNLKKVLK